MFSLTGRGWILRYYWILKALESRGYDLFMHESLIWSINDTNPEAVSMWFYVKGQVKTLTEEEVRKTKFDVCVYNHATIYDINKPFLSPEDKHSADWEVLYANNEPVPEEVLEKQRNLKLAKPNAEVNLFLKPTAPDQFQHTLEEFGYGSYSSLTYEEPDLSHISNEQVSEFLNTKVKKWIKNNDNKWGENNFKIRTDLGELNDYYLIIGQCDFDRVLNDQDFPDTYLLKLKSICKELNRIDPKRDIVIKLHPGTDGANKHKDNSYSDFLLKDLKTSDKVHVCRGDRSIYDFLPKAKCVILGNSGAAFEAMMFQKPIISFCQPEYHWVTYDLRKVCDLWRAIQTDVWFDEEKSNKFLYWYMMEYCIYDDKSTKKRIDYLLDVEDVYIRIK